MRIHSVEFLPAASYNRGIKEEALMRRFWILVAALMVFGCSKSGSDNRVIKIGFAGPMTGDQASFGIDTYNGVQLAVIEANRRGEILPGYKLKAVGQDDQHNPSQAVSVATRFVADPSVLAVIGHFNSSCTKPASAVYHEAHLLQITPSSTNPEISRQGFDTFYRISATDDVQGPKAAEFVAKKLNAKSVFVIDDKTTYGKGLADEFEKKARALGITVLGHEGITQGDKDFTPLLVKVKQEKPDLIYFGGIYPEAALLIRQARGIELNSTFMGGDGIFDPAFIRLTSPELAEGTYTTMVGGDIHQLPRAKEFISNYEKEFGPVGTWSAYSYDAANLVIQAIQKAGKFDRAAIVAAMRKIKDFPGVTGVTNFDSKGDNLNRVIGVYKVAGGELVYIGPAE